MPQKQYVVEKTTEIANLDSRTERTNYIPISEHDLKESEFLDSACDLIKAKKYNALQERVDRKLLKGDHASDVYLVKTLLLISQRDYTSAIRLLPMFKDAYPKLEELLTIDLRIEIERKNSPKNPVNKFFTEYQALADKYSDDKILKNIIVIRLRFLQYSI
jgi:hypothetical protein